MPIHVCPLRRSLPAVGAVGSIAVDNVDGVYIGVAERIDSVDRHRSESGQIVSGASVIRL
jgi:hypothetical protein